MAEMKALKFKLSGKSAFFKKPEVNTYCYFTYGNIHKVALLGIFGSIIGYNGYGDVKNFMQDTKRKKKQPLKPSYPDFYEKLVSLKIAITPLTKTGVINKKVQRFNNSVGYASAEQGGNLIVKQQWLENPAWQIYLLLDSPLAVQIKDKIAAHQCEYYPYLGSNDHFADITDISVEQLQEVQPEYLKLNCLAMQDNFSVRVLSGYEKRKLYYQGIKDVYMTFKYQETLPYELDAYTNNYILKNFIYTDDYLSSKGKAPVYELADGNKISFC